MTSSSDGTKLAAVNESGYVYFTDDSGASWTLLDAAGTDKIWSAIAPSGNGNKLIATVFGGHIYTGEYY